MRLPAMTPAEIAAYPDPAPTVRVGCYRCWTTLYVGDSDPDGGAEAVYEAAGCGDTPATCPGMAPDLYEPPTPAGLEGGGVLAGDHLLPVEAFSAVEAAEAAVDVPADPGA